MSRLPRCALEEKADERERRFGYWMDRVDWDALGIYADRLVGLRDASRGGAQQRVFYQCIMSLPGAL